MVVDQAYRGQGIGSEIMRRLLERLAHVEEIVLNCHDDLIPFYERLGFRAYRHDLYEHLEGRGQRMTVIGLAGAPQWADEITTALADYGAEAAHYTDRTGYVAQLADDRAALILVDGADTDWRFWTVTPKISPATRRIPVVLVTDDAQQRDAGAARWGEPRDTRAMI